MSTVSTASAAFYQFFQAREAGTAARQAGDGTGEIAKSTTSDARDASQASNPISSIGSTQLKPDQVRSQLKTLIAGQIEAAELSHDQGIALQRALGSDDSGAKPPTPVEQAEATPPEAAFSISDQAKSYKPSDVLAIFIQNLKSRQVSSTSYGSTGASPPKNTSSQLLDFET